jgi:transcriptional regulator with XRE-family HTH domain
MNTKKHYTTADLEKDFGPLTFGRALESFRLCEEYSLTQLAKKLKISPQSLCDLEKGRRIPSVNRAVEIAMKLNEPLETWVQLALNDILREADLNFKIEIKKVS